MKNLYPIVILALLISCKNSNKPSTPKFENLVDKGQAYIKNNQLDSAIISFQKAIQIEPNKPGGYYGLGVVYTLNCGVIGEDCEKAIEYFNKVLQMNSAYRRVYYNRAICRKKLGDHQGAINDLDLQISLDNTDPDYFHNRAVIKLYL